MKMIKLTGLRRILKVCKMFFQDHRDLFSVYKSEIITTRRPKMEKASSSSLKEITTTQVPMILGR